MSDKNSCPEKITTQQHEDEDQEPLEEVYEITSNGGGLMLKLPTEIFFDILFRLSIKILSTCRFVCKSWFYTIKIPCFLATYNTKVLHNNSSFIILQKGDCFHMVDVDHKSLDALGTRLTPYTPKFPPHQRIESIYSCNGLLFLVSLGQNRCCICNPITGDHIAVPMSPFYEKCPLTFRNIFGFGYDATSKVSKVIWISYTRRGVYVQVYNVGMGKWSFMEEKDVSIKSCMNGEEVLVGHLRLFSNNVVPNVFINGALHWIAMPRQQLKAIISFKLDTEEFQLLPLPLGFSISKSVIPRAISRNVAPMTRNYLLAIEGCLSLVEFVNNNHFEIWVMKDYGLESSWEKKYIINIVIDNLYFIRGPIQFLQSGDILLKSSGQNLGYYHPVTKLYRPIDIGHISNPYLDLKASLHVGSLLSPQDIGTQERGDDAIPLYLLKQGTTREN